VLVFYHGQRLLVDASLVYNLPTALRGAQRDIMIGLFENRELCNNNPQAAMIYVLQVRERLEASGFALGVAWTYREQADALYCLGQYSQARALIHQSFERFQTLGCPAGIASSTNLLGIVELESGNLALAKRYFEQFIALCRELGLQRDEAIGLGNLSETLLEMGNPWRAIEQITLGVQLLRSHYQSPGDQAWMQANLGRIYLELGQFTRAATELEAALEQQRRVGDDRYSAQTLWWIAEIHKAQGALGRSERCLLEAVQLMERCRDRYGQSKSLIELGKLQLESERFYEAQRSAEAALSLAVQIGSEINALDARLLHLQIVTRLPQQPDDLLKNLHAALGEAERLERPAGQRIAHALLMRVFEQREDYRSALSYQRSLTVLERALQSEEGEKRITGIHAQLELEDAKRSAQSAREIVRQEREVRESLEQTKSLLERQVLEDDLTGAFNRRYLNAQLPLELARAKRFKRSLSLAMLDIDHFKSVNDQHSHGIGDAVLRELVIVMRQSLRDGDAVARYGGEEFALILPETPLSAALEVCERVRVAVQQHPWQTLHADLAGVTVSIGVATSSQADADLLGQADARLLEAKRSGRNRVCAGDVSPS